MVIILHDQRVNLTQKNAAPIVVSLGKLPLSLELLSRLNNGYKAH